MSDHLKPGTTPKKAENSADTRKDPSDMCVSVAVEAPLQRLFTYRLPQNLDSLPAIGQKVTVPLGKRKTSGHIVELFHENETFGYKEVLSVHSEKLSQGSVSLLVWAARYYCYPPGEALKLARTSGSGQSGKRYEITKKGKEALIRQDGFLQVQGLELDPNQKSLLKRLSEATRSLTRKYLLRSGWGKAVSALEKRGLIAEEKRPVTQPKTRKETFVKTSRTVTEIDAERMARRSPKLWALYQEVVNAKGSVSLTKLRSKDKAAKNRVRKLEKRGLFVTEEVENPRDPLSRIDGVSCPRVKLNPQQREAISTLETAINKGGFKPFLLHGVTGSGKTEIYLNLIGKALNLGRSALTLVPEIALTPQLAGRFHSRFPGRVAVLHSGLTKAERRDGWQAIKSGRLDIVVGARSALFAPLENLGVIVVDEEHDGSFKQQDGLRYQARDLAVVRAQQEQAIVVLGSATPSLESYANALAGRYELLKLPNRATQRPLPHVDIVDLKKYETIDGALTAPLLTALGETLEKGQQTILFLNRRGFAPYLICSGCGEAVPCPNCSVSLTWHKKHNKAVCHYCGHTIPTPKRCPSCGTPEPRPVGFGTEKLTQVVRDHFPQCRVARLDRDSSSFGRINQVLDSFRQHKIDVLVGTQMVTKGHDFPGVTLVGVILADHGLNFPDFRSSERTFQLLCQVAGRAGRGDQPGRVLIQTFNPTHHSIVCSKTHNYEEFFQKEFHLRKRLGYPPCGHLVAIKFQGSDAKDVVELATTVAQFARRGWEDKGVEILGPSEAPLSKLRGKSRWHLLLKSPNRAPLHELTAQMTQLKPASSKDLRMSIDVDPLDMM